MSKRIPSENKLKVLDLSFNRLISLSGLERIHKIKDLNLSNNYVADDQLLFLSNLPKLKFLNLSNNNLKTNVICNIIGTLNKLEV